MRLVKLTMEQADLVEELVAREIERIEDLEWGPNAQLHLKDEATVKRDAFVVVLGRLTAAKWN
jgi:hypothetical protein